MEMLKLDYGQLLDEVNIFQHSQTPSYILKLSPQFRRDLIGPGFINSKNTFRDLL